jgi:hypothetical protein
MARRQRGSLRWSEQGRRHAACRVEWKEVKGSDNGEEEGEGVTAAGAAAGSEIEGWGLAKGWGLGQSVARMSVSLSAWEQVVRQDRLKAGPWIVTNAGPCTDYSERPLEAQSPCKTVSE